MVLPWVLRNQGLCVTLWALASGCDQTLHGLLLILPGLVVEQDAHCDKDGANGRQAGDFVAENNDAEPDRQGMLHSAGNTMAIERRVRLQVCTPTVQPSAGSDWQVLHNALLLCCPSREHG